MICLCVSGRSVSPKETSGCNWWGKEVDTGMVVQSPRELLIHGIYPVLERRGPRLTSFHSLCPSIRSSQLHPLSSSHHLSQMPPAGPFVSSQVTLYLPSFAHLLLPLPLLFAFLMISSFPNAFHSSKPCPDGTSSMRCLWRNTLSGALRTQSLPQNVALTRARARVSGSPLCPMSRTPANPGIVPKRYWMNQ